MCQCSGICRKVRCYLVKFPAGNCSQSVVCYEAWRAMLEVEMWFVVVNKLQCALTSSWRGPSNCYRELKLTLCWSGWLELHLLVGAESRRHTPLKALFSGLAMSNTASNSGFSPSLKQLVFRCWRTNHNCRGMRLCKFTCYCAFFELLCLCFPLPYWVFLPIALLPSYKR